MKDGNLRALERQHLPRLHWASIETAMTGGGVPDMNYCGDCAEGWVENKQCTGWKPAFRVEQIGWILRRKRAGGRVFIATRRQNVARGVISDELYLTDGAHVALLASDGLQAVPHLLTSSGGPARWDWPAMQRHLLGGQGR